MNRSSGNPIVSSNGTLHPFIKKWRSETTAWLSQYQTALSNRDAEKKEISRIEQEIKSLEEVQQIVQTAAAEIEQRVHKQIATVVSRCLSAVFGKDAYQFEIKFLKKRGKTEALLTFFRNGEYVDPLTAAGGGVVDIGSFALRVTSILSAVPRLRRLVVLDEPFRHLAVELRPVAIQLLRKLSKELKVQFIVVSHFHKSELAELGNSGKIIEVKK